ncbi:MAG: HAD family hydrolase [Anaerolineae bacterium]
MTLRAIIFDLGGTLIEYAGEYARWPDLETPGFAAAYRHLNQNGYHLPEFERFKRIGFAMLPGRWQAAVRGEKNLRLVDLLDGVLGELGVTGVPHPLLEEAAERYQHAICAQARPVPGGREVLGQLKARGFQLGLLSNTMFTGAAHRADLERFGLAPFFDTMLFSADLNKWKPTPAPFRHVLSELGVEPGAAVYIGDDPASDVVGAKRAGMRAIHFQSSQRFGAADVAPDAQIQGLDELPPLLTRWAEDDAT